MKTYLLVWFSSEGANPSEISRRLMSLGSSRFREIMTMFLIGETALNWMKL